MWRPSVNPLALVFDKKIQKREVGGGGGGGVGGRERGEGEGRHGWSKCSRVKLISWSCLLRTVRFADLNDPLYHRLNAV